MRRILPYNLFESNVPFTRENIQKSIREKINESEVESIITDMCADFMDEYNVAIHFDWGWVMQDRFFAYKPADFRKDSEIRLIRDFKSKKWDTPEGQDGRDKYLKEVDESTTRFVQVIFDRYSRGSESLKIWKSGLDIDFLNIMDFVRNYFPSVEIKQQGGITSEAMAARFNVIFK